MAKWLEGVGECLVPMNIGSHPCSDIHMENSHQFVGKIHWTQKATRKYPQIHWKIPADTPEKNAGIFTSICRGTASHNVYLIENSWKLKTVHAVVKLRQKDKIQLSNTAFQRVHKCSFNKFFCYKNGSMYTKVV